MHGGGKVRDRDGAGSRWADELSDGFSDTFIKFVENFGCLQSTEQVGTDVHIRVWPPMLCPPHLTCPPFAVPLVLHASSRRRCECSKIPSRGSARCGSVIFCLAGAWSCKANREGCIRAEGELH